MGGLGFYILFLGVPFVVGLVIQGWMRSTFARTSRIPVASGLSGAEVARTILDRNGLHGVPVRAARGGGLSDHYDPRNRTVNLSEEVYQGRSVAASAVAAHEVGHAIQHATAYTPMKVRSAVWPVAAFGSQAWFILLIIGAVLGGFGGATSGTSLGILLVNIAILLFAAVVLFQFITLPVEFNASRRAAQHLQEAGLVNSGAEAAGVRSTLTAAAMTYVAAALVALSQLIYFLMRR